MRDAIMLLEQVGRVAITTAEQYQRLIGHRDDAPEIINHLVAGRIAEAFAALDEALTRVADAASIANDAISVLRDVLVLRCGGEITKTGVALAARQNLALALDTAVVMASLKVLWQLKTKIRNDDARSMLELALIMLSEILHTTAISVGRMSLGEMAKFQ
jgi:DNA polymerase III gamma/tau subunit